jgi:hypothetical protein
MEYLNKPGQHHHTSVPVLRNCAVLSYQIGNLPLIDYSDQQSVHLCLLGLKCSSVCSACAYHIHMGSPDGEEIYRTCVTICQRFSDALIKLGHADHVACINACKACILECKKICGSAAPVH